MGRKLAKRAGGAVVDPRTSMNILAFDTALNACSIALVSGTARDNELIARTFQWRPRGHAEVLAPLIKELLAEAGWSFGMIDKIAVTTGPGSFTGVRVGLAAARGIAVASGIPAIGLSTLEAIGANARGELDAPGTICVAVDARRGEIYSQTFTHELEPVSEPAAVSPAHAVDNLTQQGIVIIGSGAHLIAEQLAKRGMAYTLSSALGVPDAGMIGQMALGREARTQPPVPLYLRAADAKAPTTPSLLMPE